MRRLGAQLAPHPLRAHLLQHPFFKERLGRAPQVELRVKLAAQALDVEQRFLQQHQLGLDLHLKAARCLEQPHEHHSQRDFLERPVEIRLAHRANGRLQIVGARLGGDPAAFDVQLGHALVIAAKKRYKVLR
ncbi:hypothetical protein D3C71_1709430 [compost metagenome]